jgi:trehalose 6-phosphate phosphatase
MLHILAKRHRHRLAEFASANVLVAFDFDGTLAPIVRNPARARMRPETRRLLTSVARRYPCVVISGRSRTDLGRVVGSVPVWHLAGNHGVEPWAASAKYASKVQGWVAELERTIPRGQGIVIEDKTYSVTLHYRHARNKARALAAINAAVRRVRGARILGGKAAVSLIPRGAPNKGVALERARRLLVCDSAMYVGDDDTDEDAFAQESDRLLGIRVGLAPDSHARYGLKNQKEVDDLLKALLALRPLRREAAAR